MAAWSQPPDESKEEQGKEGHDEELRRMEKRNTLESVKHLEHFSDTTTASRLGGHDHVCRTHAGNERGDLHMRREAT